MSEYTDLNELVDEFNVLIGTRCPEKAVVALNKYGVPHILVCINGSSEGWACCRVYAWERQKLQVLRNVLRRMK